MDKEHVPFLNHDVLAKIFRHINSRTLSKCAQVCSLWYEMSVAEKKRRTSILWTLKVYPPSNDYSVMESELFNALENIPIQPAFCIASMTIPLFKDFKKYFPSFGSTEHKNKKQRLSEDVRKGKYLNKVKHTALAAFLPESCPVAFTVASSILGFTVDCKPIKIVDGPAVSAVYIPEVPGFKVSYFSMNNRNYNLSRFLAENSPVKGILIFMPREPKYSTKLIQTLRLDNKDLKMAVGGAFVEHTDSFLGFVTAFSGPNAEAASIVIQMDDGKEEIMAKFETFQETGLLNHKCFAYMFLSDKRSFSWNRKEKILESEVFSQMYSNVPLFGIYSYKKLGCNYLPNFPKEKILKAGKFVENRRGFFYSDVSVVVLISLKAK
ncbi:hypothetical protein NPIL_581391 [Nephila pilipes]|uniref:F-box domain-containing protein n=1 Tax=Nephila pilipes TaxID=299642 RepID=A0A8X6UG55_NEPPI|nr:hypothetical protein NPIL_581391 [Nephila pilipes]